MSEFSRGWKIVMSAVIGLALGCRVIMIYGFGVFSPPMMRDFGWSATETQFALTTFNVGAILSIPLLGLVSRRLTLRAIIIVSQVGMSAALLAIALIPNSPSAFYFLSGLVAVFGVGTLPITWTKLIALWFNRHRGLATGVALLGTGLGGSLLKPFTATLVANFGWRGAFVGFATISLVLGLPLAVAWARTPEVTAGDGIAEVETTRGSASTYLLDWRFWLLSLSLIPAGATIGGLIANSERILVAHGIASTQVVSITMLIGISVSFWRVSGGFLLDHVNAALLGAIALVALATACLLLTSNPISFYQAVVAIALLGMAAGVELDVVAIFCSRTFGLTNYVQIYGAALVMFLAGDALGAVGFSYIARLYGNLNIPLQTAAALLLISVAMMTALSMVRPVRSA